MHLTDTQLLLLSRAAQRNDRLITPPEDMPGKTLQTLRSRLLRISLVEEVSVRSDQPHLRCEADGHLLGLRITDAGLQALGIDAADGENGAPPPGRVISQAHQPTSVTVRPGTKRALVLYLLRRDGGASLDELVGATGWLPHTTRAALTGLRKAGHVIVRDQSEVGGSTYRILTREADPIASSAHQEAR